MQPFHVYEVVGEILFRRSGNDALEILECKVIRTRAIARPRESGADVSISVIVSGFENYHFNTWFEEWTQDDDLGSPNFQGGRPIDIAVPIDAYHAMLITGKPVTQPSLQSTHSVEVPDFKPPSFSYPVAAVLINGEWVEPQRRNSAHDPLQLRTGNWSNDH